jgi:hypothetical protein
VVEVPPQLPLDAHMNEEDEDAHAVLARAQAIAETYDVDVSPCVVHARDAAEAIVEQARRTGAELLVVGGTCGGRIQGTIRDVLRKARAASRSSRRAPRPRTRRSRPSRSRRRWLPAQERVELLERAGQRVCLGLGEVGEKERELLAEQRLDGANRLLPGPGQRERVAAAILRNAGALDEAGAFQSRQELRHRSR